MLIKGKTETGDDNKLLLGKQNICSAKWQCLTNFYRMKPFIVVFYEILISQNFQTTKILILPPEINIVSVPQ